MSSSCAVTATDKIEAVANTYMPMESAIGVSSYNERNRRTRLHAVPFFSRPQ